MAEWHCRSKRFNWLRLLSRRWPIDKFINQTKRNASPSGICLEFCTWMGVHWHVKLMHDAVTRAAKFTYHTHTHGIADEQQPAGNNSPLKNPDECVQQKQNNNRKQVETIIRQRVTSVMRVIIAILLQGFYSSNFNNFVAMRTREKQLRGTRKQFEQMFMSMQLNRSD